MAPADNLSPAGSSSYSSDTLTVGDGTWDFTKNTFLLPNLMGVNFETMQYNGMGNRLASLTQYHNIITAHGVIAAITFLFIVPAAVLIKRFYRAPRGVTTRYHVYLQILTIGLTTVVFILGFLAVGPRRNLTNPHHGLGVAIYVLVLAQSIGGFFIKHVRGRSIRVQLHRWGGRATALLGIAQIPLGLTLYGSPKFTFVLYTLWMTFLLLVYFILSHTHEGERGYIIDGGRSASHGRTEKSGGGVKRWLGPLAAGAGALALIRGRQKERSRSRSRARAHSRSRSRSRSRIGSHSRGRTEVISSRHDSPSYMGDEEKFSETPPRKEHGGFMNKALGASAALGAGAFLSKLLGGRRDKHSRDEEYSAVATDTPSRPSRLRRYQRPAESEFTDYTEDLTSHGGGSSLPPRDPSTVMSSEPPPRMGGRRPMPPRASYVGHSRVDSGLDPSDYSSYVSPSRRPEKSGGGGGLGKGLMAGLGLGWLAKKMQDGRGKRSDDKYDDYEDDRRPGRRGPSHPDDRYTSPTPGPRLTRRPTTGRPMAPPSGITATNSMSDESSTIEPRPARGNYVPPPASPLAGNSEVTADPVTPPRRRTSRSRSHSRREPVEYVSMPPMPPASSVDSPSDESALPERGAPPRRHRDGEAAAAAAVATASRLAAEEEERRRAEGSSAGPSSNQPVSVRVKLHEDRDRNITLRRLTEEEQAAARRGSRRRRNDSVSSLSDTDSPGSRRYRRDSSSQRRAERAAEQAAGGDPLSPPAPAFAGAGGGGNRRPKDSAYYSGQPGPSGATPAAGATVSSFGSPESHGTWSAMSPPPSGPYQDAADRRRRRRMERRDSSRQSNTVDFS